MRCWIGSLSPRRWARLSTLHGTPIWELYVQGREAQAAIEAELAKTLAAEGNGRAQVLAQWMQAVLWVRGHSRASIGMQQNDGILCFPARRLQCFKNTPESNRTVKNRQIEVLSIAEGFFHSSILFALLKLKVFERIDRGSTTLQELAAELETHPETLSRLLNAGVVLKLLESKDGFNFGIAPACRTVLSPSDDEHYIGDWIRSLDYFCAPLLKLDEAILNSGPTIEPSAHLGGTRKVRGVLRCQCITMHRCGERNWQIF